MRYDSKGIASNGGEVEEVVVVVNARYDADTYSA